MEISVSELIQALKPSAQSPSAECVTQRRHMGKQIVVLDRGFVYVGNVTIEGDFLTIADARCIRYWGTTKGLGELRNGPTDKTKLDDAGTVQAPLKSLIHFVTCQKDW